MREFFIKFRDEIVKNNLNKDAQMQIVCDRASFHQWTHTNLNYENSNDKIGMTRLGSMISQLDLAE